MDGMEGTGLSLCAGCGLSKAAGPAVTRGCGTAKCPPPGHLPAGVGAIVPLLRRVLVPACPLHLRDSCYPVVAPSCPRGHPKRTRHPSEPPVPAPGVQPGLCPCNGAFGKDQQSCRRCLKQILPSSRDKTTLGARKVGPSPVLTDPRPPDHIPLTASKTHSVPLQK